MIGRAGMAMLALALVATGCNGDDESRSRTSASAPTGTKPCANARGLRCFELAVPLDRSRPGGAELRLPVAVVGDEDAPRGVLLTLAGGPGQPGVPSLGKFLEALGPAADDYRVVALDQRGTGEAAIQCPQLQAQMGSSDLLPPTPAAVRACFARVGRSAARFGTDDVVADIEALRRALGVRRISLDGISYGTYTAERYALAHPDHVARLVLDSVVPHASRDDLQRTGIRAATRVLRDVCRRRDCPGDPVADLAAAVRTTGQGPRILDALVLLSIVDPSFSRAFDVPAILHSAAAGNGAALERLLARTRRWERFPADELSQGLHASALCGDWLFAWGGSDAPLAGRAAALRRALAGLDARDLRPFDRATAAGNGITRQCLPWGPAAPTPPVAADARLPDVPTLLLGGGHDLSTPLEWARREAALAPGGRLVVVPTAGHSVQRRGGPTARRALRSFLSGR